MGFNYHDEFFEILESLLKVEKCLIVLTDWPDKFQEHLEIKGYQRYNMESSKILLDCSGDFSLESAQEICLKYFTNSYNDDTFSQISHLLIKKPCQIDLNKDYMGPIIIYDNLIEISELNEKLDKE